MLAGLLRGWDLGEWSSLESFAAALACACLVCSHLRSYPITLATQVPMSSDKVLRVCVGRQLEAKQVVTEKEALAALLMPQEFLKRT